MRKTEFRLETIVEGDMESCFGASLDVGLHVQSMSRHWEKVVDGRCYGPLKSGERVTWEAIHFGIPMRFTAEIVAMEAPTYFKDRMVKGPFCHFEHEHFFERCGARTKMIDVIKYSVPFGWGGEIFNRLYLKTYLVNLITSRNRMLKAYVEKRILTSLQ